MKGCRLVLSAAFISAVLLFSQGCVSVKWNNETKPLQKIEPEKLKFKCHVSSINSYADGMFDDTIIGMVKLYRAKHGLPEPAMGTPIDKKAAALALNDLIPDRLMARYPSIFTSDKENSMPLVLNVKGKHKQSIALTLLLEIGTLCIIAGILPDPIYFTDAYDFTMSVNQSDVLEAGSFTAQSHSKLKGSGWITIFTPLALIPFPGKGELRGAGVLMPGGTYYDEIGNWTLDAFSDQMAATLAAPENSAKLADMYEKYMKAVNSRKLEQKLTAAGVGNILKETLGPEILDKVEGKGKTAAVLNFDAKSGISQDESALLADRFTSELEKARVFTIVSRSKMAEVLKLQNFSRSDSCSATECAVEAGQLLGVQYMIYGSIGKIGSLYTLNTYSVNVETGATVASATTDWEGTIEKFLTEGMAQNVKMLLISAAHLGEKK